LRSSREGASRMEGRPKERRKKPRVTAGLAAQLSSESGEASGLAAETVNVSMAGVCCRSSNPIAPLTKVKMTLLVPETRPRKKEKTAVVRAEGVVVRTELTTDGSDGQQYEIACAFTVLGGEDRAILEAYVDGRLGAGGAPPGKAGWRGAGLPVGD